MSSPFIAHYHSPIGMLRISAGEQGVTGVTFVSDEAGVVESPEEVAPATPAFECVQQLDEYFSGRRREFSLPLTPEGSDFEQRVWNDLMTIPYGRTRSYIELARRLGSPKAARAVGLANGRNRVAIIVPCHRCIGSDGTLTGYAGGLWRKQWLLEHEGALRQARLL